MSITDLLWIDLTTQPATSDFSAGLSVCGYIHHCSRNDDIPALIHDIRPDVLCFDFDYPDASDLGRLQETKQSFPSLPILMFSGDPTTGIAVWALRNRVWDYFVKPVGVKEILARLQLLSQIHTHQRKRRARNIFIPDSTLPARLSPDSSSGNLTPMRAAIQYATEHYHEKVPLALLARQSGMGVYAFSRAFKRTYQITFRDFMMKLRMNEAAALLNSSRKSILDVASCVGFNDPSHFTRMFHRCHGMTPSAYRARSAAQTYETVRCAEDLA